MKCYYEELDVARDASDAEIKTAYRKMALRWHPDKNLSSSEEAKERFQLIQQAYEVLSDAQERAWYDNHREQILRGKNSDYEDNSLDLFAYFTVSCYKGHGDDAKGFFAVYRDVFEKIAAEDAEFMEDEEELADIPKFGDSQSSYEEVVGPFYAHWAAYCTKKTYTWLCPYDIQEIKDRRILREIEKDLKKIVQKAKKERNEEVRNLVAFIRKRDRRVQAYKAQLEERAALNRQKQEQMRLEQIRKRQREVEEMRQQNNSHHAFEGYEEQLKQLAQEYSGSEGDDDDDSEGDNDSAEDENADAAAKEAEEELYMDDLYCVACNRMFKNEKAFANHETSKKHRDNVELLRQEMQQDEEAYQNSDDDDEGAEDEQTVKSAAEDVSEGNVEEENGFGEATLSEEVEEEAQEVPIAAKKNKKNKKSKKAQKPQINQALSDLSDHEEVEPVNEFAPTANEDNSDAEDWHNSNKKGSARKNKTKKQTKKQTETKTTATATTTATVAPLKDTSAPDIAEQLSKATLTAVEDDAIAAPPTHVCVTCHAPFDSKNKLFAHLKKTNHGVYIPKTKAPTEPEKSSASNKKAKGKRNK